MSTTRLPQNSPLFPSVQLLSGAPAIEIRRIKKGGEAQLIYRRGDVNRRNN